MENKASDSLRLDNTCGESYAIVGQRRAEMELEKDGGILSNLGLVGDRLES